MSCRWTTTEKWEDGWFRKLPVNTKLLYLYILDKCDIAGFWEVDLELASIFTGISKKAISGAKEGLKRAFIEKDSYVWVRNFIKRQRNWPLNPDNNCHKAILSILESHSEFEVDFLKELNKIIKTPLLGPDVAPCNSNSKGNSNVKVKKAFGKEFQKVKLTEDEHRKLIEKFGDAAVAKIDNLDSALASKGYKYASHYATILNWARRDSSEPKSSKTKLFPLGGKVCGKEGCSMPAVYKTSGEYDHYFCLEHSPQAVRDKYRS